MQLFARFIFAVVALVIVMPNQVLATGPRVTTSLFSPHHNQIHALDFPPFVSSEVGNGGREFFYNVYLPASNLGLEKRKGFLNELVQIELGKIMVMEA